MADRSVTVILRANTGQYQAALGQASASTLRLGQTVDSQTARMNSGFMGMGLSAKNMVGALAFAGVITSVGQLASSFLDFDSAMSEVAASTMATGSELESLRSLAMEAGASTKYSATEAALGINELAKAGVSTADIMGGGLAGALDLAAAGGLEVADAAEIAATAISVFGLKGSDMSHVADLLAAGAGKAQGSVDDLAMAMNQSAVVADQTGLSIEETTGALALFASNGLTGSDAGTSFKTMLTSLNPRSAEAAALMDELGISAYDSQGNFIGLANYAGVLHNALSGMSDEQRNATLQTIFGSDAIRAASMVYEAGAPGVQNWIDNVDDSGFAAEQAALKADNLRGDLEKLGGALETAFIKGGAGANDEMRAFVQQLTEIVPQIAPVIGSLFEVAGAFMGLGASVLGIAGPVLGFIGGLPGPAIAAAGAFALLFRSRGMIGNWASSVMSGVGGLAEGLSTAGTRADGAAGSFGKLGGVARGLRGAISGAVESLGGFIATPAGGAITGLTLAFTAYSAASEYAAEVSAAFRAQLSQIAEDAVKSDDPFATASEGLADLNKEMDEFTDHPAGMILDQAFDIVPSAGEAYGKLALELAKAGAELDPLAEKATTVEEKQLALNQAVDKYGPESEEAAAASDDLSAAQDDLSSSQEEVASVTADVSESLKEEADALAGVIDAMSSFRDINLSVEESQQSFNDTMRDMSTAWTEAQTAANGAGIEMVNAAGQINTTTEAGSALQDKMVSAGDAIVSMYESTAKEAQSSGATQEEANTQAAAAAGVLQQSFIDQMVAMGLTSEQAQLLADRYLAIPTSIATKIDVSGAEDTDAAIGSVRDKLLELPPNTPIEVTGLTADAMKGLQDLGFEVKTLPNGTVTVAMTAETAVADQRMAESRRKAEDLRVAADELGNAWSKIPGEKSIRVTDEATSEDVMQKFSNVTTTANAIPELTTANTSTNADDTRQRIQDLDTKIRGVPVSHHTTTTSNAPDQTQNFATLGQRISGVPTSQSTTTWSNATQQSGNFHGLSGAVGSVPGWVSSLVSSNSDAVLGSIRTLIGAMQSLNGMHSTVTVTENRVGRATAAAGGLILGPGSSTSDSIPALLSNGEFVMRAAAVERYGLAMMSALNQGLLPGLAAGGPTYASTRANTAAPIFIPASPPVPAESAAQPVINNYIYTQPGDDPSKVAATTSRRQAWEQVSR